jgi:hypothetical protein
MSTRPTLHSKCIDFEDRWKIVGVLTLHGVTKEATLDVESAGVEAKDPWGNLRTGAAATAVIIVINAVTGRVEYRAGTCPVIRTQQSEIGYARALPYSTSRRLHAFSASGSL